MGGSVNYAMLRLDLKHGGDPLASSAIADVQQTLESKGLHEQAEELSRMKGRIADAQYDLIDMALTYIDQHLDPPEPKP